MVMGKSWSKFLIFVVMTILFVLFQNCEVKKGGGNSLVTLAGNGGAYDGKLLVEAPESATPGSKEEIKIDGGTKPYKVTVTPTNVQLQKVSEDQYIIEIPNNIGSPNILIEVEDSGLGEDKQKVEASIQIIGKNQFLYKIQDLKVLNNGKFVAIDKQSESLVFFNSIGEISNSVKLHNFDLNITKGILYTFEKFIYLVANKKLFKIDYQGNKLKELRDQDVDYILPTEEGVFVIHQYRRMLSLYDHNLILSEKLIDRFTGYDRGDSYWGINSLSRDKNGNILLDCRNYDLQENRIDRVDITDRTVSIGIENPRPSRNGYFFAGILQGDTDFLFKENLQLLPQYPSSPYPNNDYESLQEVNPYNYYYLDETGEIKRKLSFEVPWSEGPKPILKLLTKTPYGYITLLENKIAIFDDNGKLISEWDSAGMKDREFNVPCGMAINDKDELYVADANNRRIQVYNNEGQLISSYTNEIHGVPYIGQKSIENCLFDISLDSKGRIYANSGVEARTANLEYVEFDTQDYKVKIIDPYGHADTQSLQSSLYYYTYVSNSLHVTSTGQILVQKTNIGEDLSKYYYSRRQVIVLDSEGNHLFDWNGGLAPLKEMPEDPPMDPPWARGNDGNFDMVNKKNGNIIVLSHKPALCGEKKYCHFFEYDSDLNLIRSFGELDLENLKESPLQEPRALALDSNDNIYVTDIENHNINILDSNGNHLKSFGKKGRGAGEFYYPQGIAVDSKGNIWVSDTGNNRLVKLKPFEDL